MKRSLAATLAAVVASTVLVPPALAGRYETVSQSVIRFHGASQARERAPLALPVATPRAEPELAPRAEPEPDAEPGPVSRAESRAEPEPDAVAAAPEADGKAVEVARPDPVEPKESDEGVADGEPVLNGGEEAPALELAEEAEKRRRREMRLERTRAHKRQLGEATRNVDQ